MARKLRDSGLEGRSARLKLPIRLKPYTGPTLARGIKLLYRRNKSNGSWVVKASDGHGAYWTKAFAVADDYEDSNGKTVLTFYEAQDVAKTLARSGDAATSETAPISVTGALDDYRRDLEARGAATFNADYPRKHLTGVLLAKPVALLTSKELRTWRDGLLGTLKPSSVNRLCKTLCTALKQAAQHDARIKNAKAWDVGLASLPDAQTARNVILDDRTVLGFVNASYQRNEKLGLLTDVLAESGARPSQAVRLLVEDLHGGTKPKLAMPKSGKGGSKNRARRKSERYSVPISIELADKLRVAAKGRRSNAPLLLQSDGQPWSERPSDDYREDIREVVKSIGLDPDEVTLYALRHSSIVRQLLKPMNVEHVAKLHDTSASAISSNYAKYITEAEHAEDIARAALLQRDEPAPVADNVITLTAA